MNIYCLNDIIEINDNDLIQLLPIAEKDRIIKIGNQQKRAVSATAFLLFLYAAYKEFGIAGFDVIRSDKGKPYIEGNPIYFSYSHTKDSAACAVSNSPIGIDLEKIRVFNEAVAKRVCTPDELNALASINSEKEKGILFCKMWVQKEAFSKMTGNGFSEGFNGIDTMNNANTGFIFNEKKGEYIGISTNSGLYDLRLTKVDFNAVLQDNPKIYSSL